MCANPPPPPISLSPAERAALEALSADARWRFEALATQGEFVQRKSIVEAESDAFAAVMAEHRSTGGNG